jgi:chloride channel protein, CIC family
MKNSWKKSKIWKMHLTEKQKIIIKELPMKPWRYPSRWALFKMDDRLLMMFIGAIVGTCSGFAAIVLNHSLLFLLEGLSQWRQHWWAFILPAIGAALSSLFLEKVVKEGAGHGVPEVIYSVSRYGGLIRLRSTFSRLISSCLTIGSGGSAGPEAPVVMSGSAIGSNIARFFSLNDRQRVTLVGCGAAGAISSIFNAPIAGIVFTIEIILGEWTALNIIPIAIAAVAGTEISRALQGNQIVFSHKVFAIDMGDICSYRSCSFYCSSFYFFDSWVTFYAQGSPESSGLPCGYGLLLGDPWSGLSVFFSQWFWEKATILSIHD